MRKLILRMVLTVHGVAAGDDGPIEQVEYGDPDSWRDIFQTLETVARWSSAPARTARTSAPSVADAARRLEIHPTIAGRGKKLFATVATPHRVRHLGSTTSPCGVVIARYARG